MMDNQVGRMATLNDRRNEEAKLIQKVRKRVTTSFIAALAEFERCFASELENSNGFRETYGLVRTSILDRGNEQARGAEADIRSFLTTKDKNSES